MVDKKCTTHCKDGMDKTFDSELQRLFTDRRDDSHSQNAAPTMEAAGVPLNTDVHREGALRSGKRTFECPWCHRVFKKKDHMKSHTRQHTGETPYVCPNDNCDLQFKWRSSLKNHLRYHEPIITSPVTPVRKMRRAACEPKLPWLMIEASVATMKDEVTPDTKQTSSYDRNERHDGYPCDEKQRADSDNGALPQKASNRFGHNESRDDQLDFFGGFVPEPTEIAGLLDQPLMDENTGRKSNISAAMVEIEFILNPNIAS